MLNELNHRIAGPKDFEALVDLQRRATLGLSGDHYCLRSMRLALDEVPILTPDLIEDSHYHVLTDTEGEIRAGGGWSRRCPGYAAASGERNGSLPLGHALVRAVNVDPMFARQGLGCRIMTIVEADAILNGIRHLQMTATLPGIPLYRRMGYQSRAPIEGKLSNGYSVRLQRMEKSLNDAPFTIA